MDGLVKIVMKNHVIAIVQSMDSAPKVNACVFLDILEMFVNFRNALIYAISMVFVKKMVNVPVLVDSLEKVATN
jgi:hypothetical protein